MRQNPWTPLTLVLRLRRLTTNSEIVQHSNQTLWHQVCLSLFPIVQFVTLQKMRWKIPIVRCLVIPFHKWQQNWCAGLNWVGYILAWINLLREAGVWCYTVNWNCSFCLWCQRAGTVSLKSYPAYIGWYISITWSLITTPAWSYNMYWCTYILWYHTDINKDFLVALYLKRFSNTERGIR